MQERVEFSEALKTKYPEPVAYAVAKDEHGKANPITLGWFMQTSGDPAMFAIAVATTRYSVKTIRHSKCFTLVFPAGDEHDEALFFGTKSGRQVDKVGEMKVATSPASMIDSVVFDDAVANFECELAGEKLTGDHIIFIGRVVASHVNTEKVNRLYTVAPGWKMGPVEIE
ncbi:Flavoredoxin [Anaerohalosphaera lusitana]|uniref:Flavoredoxin n=1 Tax=Anaerohalosphaera lusitana TaxID=1936003 RepID=A0A1U9NIN2_9BACT|nr:flavin reductase family protein [Anaerohalosphaera lusitana]AQT67450.1 Flavoredoxin [Anaerohalosphaera lusitana]